MPSITVAMVEIDQDQSIAVERFLTHNNQHEIHVELLNDAQSNHDSTLERRRICRNYITQVDNAIARIQRLKPKILLINSIKTIDEYCDLLLALQRHCPDTVAILIIDETLVEENYLLRVLASGGHGFIPQNQYSLNFSRAIKAIKQGEVWMSRKMIGRIMHAVVAAYHHDFLEENLDSSS